MTEAEYVKRHFDPDLLAKQMKAKKVSIDDLLAMMGLSDSPIATRELEQILSGDRIPTLKVLDVIAKAMRVDIGRFFLKKKQRSKNPKQLSLFPDRW